MCNTRVEVCDDVAHKYEHKEMIKIILNIKC